MEAHKEDLQNIIKTCQGLCNLLNRDSPTFHPIEKVFLSSSDLFTGFDEKRREVRAEKAKRIRELTDPDHAWGHDEIPKVEANEQPAAHGDVDQTAAEGQVQYRALYEYTARNEDEISFNPGDIIKVRQRSSYYF